MAFSERCEYKVEILPNKTLQVRRADIILKDDVEVACSYHRHVLTPGSAITNECDCVKAIAPILWTDETIAAYEASLKPEQPEVEPEETIETISTADIQE